MKFFEGVYIKDDGEGRGYYYDNKLTPFSTTPFNSLIVKFHKRERLATIFDKRYKCALPSNLIEWGKE